MYFLTNSKYSYRTGHLYMYMSLVNYKKMLDRHSILLDAYFEAVAELYVTKTHDSKFSDLVEVEYYHDSGFDEKCLC